MKVDCSSVSEWFRFLFLLVLWGVVSWPVWSIAFSDTRYRVLDFLPFVINCLALTGNSYEAESSDWRIWSVNMLLGGALSLASSISYLDQLDPSAVSACGIGAIVSVLGAVTGFRDADERSEEFNRQITILKIACIIMGSGLVVWMNIAIYGWGSIELVTQLLCGISVSLACCASLFFVRDRKRVGVGSPLLWLGLRFVLAAGVPGFWAWICVCLFAFWFLNVMHNRGTVFDTLVAHWCNWKRIENFNASVSLTGAFSLFLLVLNGSTSVIEIIPPSSAVALGSLFARATKNATYFGDSTCIPGGIWRSLAAANAREVMNSMSARSLFPRYSRVEHFMFEESAAVAIVAMLMINSVSGYLRKARDPRAVQGFWQPVFFFSVSIMILITSYSDYEVVGYLEGWMVTTWSHDSIMAVALAFFFFVFSFLVSAFRNKDGAVERERTPFKDYKAERFRVEGVIVVCLLFGTSLLCFGQYFEAFPRQRNLHFRFDQRMNITQNGSIVELLEPLLRVEDRRLLTMAGINCTDYPTCISSLNTLENQSTGCNVSNASYVDFIAGIKGLGSDSLSYQGSFGISDLIDKEILALAVLELCAIVLLCGGLIYPALDDFGVVVTGVASAVMTIVIPYRIRETQGVVFHGSPGEWFIPVLGVLQFLMSCLSVIQRVESPHRFLIPWESVGDMEEAFRCSEIRRLHTFVMRHTGKEFSPDMTAKEIYLKLEEMASSKGERSEESVIGGDSETM